MADPDPALDDHIGCRVIDPTKGCCVDRSVIASFWGCPTPCPAPATQHARRTVTIMGRLHRFCYPICDGHMADLAANDQLQ